jgi:hypothetical protein
MDTVRSSETLGTFTQRLNLTSQKAWGPQQYRYEELKSSLCTNTAFLQQLKVQSSRNLE